MKSNKAILMNYDIDISHESWEKYDKDRIIKALLIDVSSLNLRVKELEKTLKYVSQYLRDIEAI